MATNTYPGWQPEWAVAPGENLLEALQERGMTQSELAHRLGRPVKTVNEIVKGKAAITSETAIQLERALGISARFWTSLEAQYRYALARQESQRELDMQATWADKFPVMELVKYGLMEKGRSKGDTLSNLLSFFGVSSPEAFERLSAVAAYRSSPAFAASPNAVAAWLRWGEIEASKVSCPAFDPGEFRRVLGRIRTLSRREPFDEILKKVKTECQSAGVVVVLIPELSGTHLSGATRWLGVKAVLQLSLRYKSDDQFWFTLFHEAGHILSGARRQDFVDGSGVDMFASDDSEEEKADKFARDFLLPPADYGEFVEAGELGRQAVRSFAKSQNIAPGIVVGRLQRDGHIGRNQLNDLKKPIRLLGDH
ncbi:HigA family addiction module antidote protein [Mycolicibacterium wolinskyi]|uniref:HigA family addiction module antitoxin n=1 Tax=Mycolicibacterium TaxID=1866885 RepID=UPI000A156639|nr:MULTISPECIES: HigA family addiction module antitoxin [Mycolicibacterium]MCV7284890.1 HigA family addiction module antidote protein [Mycolicibacterium wolinskyi]MCV7297950.1 HigA family addiction module antidote protein [Mycolicibacterium goodii]